MRIPAVAMSAALRHFAQCPTHFPPANNRSYCGWTRGYVLKIVAVMSADRWLRAPRRLRSLLVISPCHVAPPRTVALLLPTEIGTSRLLRHLSFR